MLMGTTIRITGAIDRAVPDPSAPSDPMSTWIGMVEAGWTDSTVNVRSAAILKVATGRGVGDPKWGQYVMLLRWIGDPPPAEVAQAVYDVILDGGPDRRDLKRVISAQPRTPHQPSYVVARAS